MTILYRRIVKNYGLTYNTMLILYVLKLKAPCSQKQISEQWEIPKQTLNTVIKELEAKKYIYFSFDKNQKEKTIHLTDQGKGFIGQTIKNLKNVDIGVYQKIGEQDCHVILNALEQFVQALEEQILKGINKNSI